MLRRRVVPPRFAAFDRTASAPARWRRSAVVVAVAAALAPALGACAQAPPVPKNALEYTENAKRAYDQAMEEYFDHDWESVVPRMEAIKRDYAYSRYARLAELRIADANYMQEKYAEAISGYKGFTHDYPNDPEVPYARYKICKAQFESSSDTILLPPLEERDLVQVMDAYTSIRQYLGDYPESKYDRELRYFLEIVTGVLARHELYVARFYLADDRFDAALVRIEFSLRNYSDSGLEPEALVLLGEVYLKKHDPAKARAAFQKVLGQYPDSPFVLPARRFLARMGEPIAVQRMGARGRPD